MENDEKTESVDYEREYKRLAGDYARVKDENYHLKIALSSLSEVIMTPYKKIQM